MTLRGLALTTSEWALLKNTFYYSSDLGFPPYFSRSLRFVSLFSSDTGIRVTQLLLGFVYIVAVTAREDTVAFSESREEVRHEELFRCRFASARRCFMHAS